VVSKREGVSRYTQKEMRRATVFPGSVLRSVCVGCILASAGASGKAASVDSTNSVSLARRSLTLADARRLAFQRNWDLLAAKSDVDIAVEIGRASCREGG